MACLALQVVDVQDESEEIEAVTFCLTLWVLASGHASNPRHLRLLRLLVDLSHANVGIHLHKPTAGRRRPRRQCPWHPGPVWASGQAAGLP